MEFQQHQLDIIKREGVKKKVREINSQATRTQQATLKNNLTTSSVAQNRSKLSVRQQISGLAVCQQDSSYTSLQQGNIDSCESPQEEVDSGEDQGIHASNKNSSNGVCNNNVWA